MNNALWFIAERAPSLDIARRVAADALRGHVDWTQYQRPVPLMRRRACFHSDQTPPHLAEPVQKLRPLQLFRCFCTTAFKFDEFSQIVQT
jgi:hypothetical protein